MGRHPASNPWYDHKMPRRCISQSRVSTARSCQRGSCTTVRSFRINSAVENQPTADSATSFTTCQSPSKKRRQLTNVTRTRQQRLAGPQPNPTPQHLASSPVTEFQQTQSLQPVPPRLIQNLIPRCSFIDDPPHPPPRHPALASAFAPATITCPSFWRCPSIRPPLFNRFVTLKFRIVNAPILPFISQIGDESVLHIICMNECTRINN